MKIPIVIPEQSTLLVRTSQHVTFTTPFVNAKTAHKKIIPLAQTLRFQPERIFLALKKVIGDRIRKGELLAEHKVMFSTRHYIANVDGILVDIDHTRGSVTIELDTQGDRTVPCYFHGEVAEIADDHIMLNVGSMQQCELVDQAESLFGGQLYYLTPGADMSDDAIENRIVYAADIDPLTAIKLSTFGARCVVTNSKKSVPDSISICYLTHPDDFIRVEQARYPFCITSHDKTHLIFYS